MIKNIYVIVGTFLINLSKNQIIKEIVFYYFSSLVDPSTIFNLHSDDTTPNKLACGRHDNTNNIDIILTRTAEPGIIYQGVITMNLFDPPMNSTNVNVSDEELIDITVPVSTFRLHSRENVTSASRSQIEIDSLVTNDDLTALKEEDPFLYYSIPSVRDFEMKLREVDTSCLKESSIRRPRSASCPPRVEVHATVTNPKIVSRKTCLSLEGHMNKVLSDYFLADDEGGTGMDWHPSGDVDMDEDDEQLIKLSSAIDYFLNNLENDD